MSLSLGAAMWNGGVSGVGFAFALVLMAAVRERLEIGRIPMAFREAPIAFLTSGLMALAFLGFSGMKVESGSPPPVAAAAAAIAETGAAREYIPVVSVLVGIGVGFGALLAVAARFLRVERDSRIDAVTALLAGANCGGCGYPGCSGYAAALVAGKAGLELCSVCPEKERVEIARLLGIAAATVDKKVARILCGGDNAKSDDLYRYAGAGDCNAAAVLFTGARGCPSGCLGLGSCVRICPFDAMSMDAVGRVVVDREKCTGCGKCVAICPRNVIRLVLPAETWYVACSSKDRGPVVRKYCKVGCTACMLCARRGPEGMFVVEENLARVVADVRKDAGDAAEKCPTHCILSDRG
jgi:electron transport complex protein RnfB